ncbi:hypothetical protein [Kocuria varians]|nr:hypothetical protein [Kocuria varians]
MPAARAAHHGTARNGAARENAPSGVVVRRTAGLRAHAASGAAWS